MDAKCKNCKFADHFKPRPDEEARGFQMGCNYPGYEGYTTPEETCSFHKPTDIERALSEIHPPSYQAFVRETVYPQPK